MNKSNKKKHIYNDEVISELVKKYDVTPTYVRMSIRGDRAGTLSVKIADEYHRADRAAKAAIKNKVNEL